MGMVGRSSVVAVVFVWLTHDVAAQKPASKMLADLAPPGRRLGRVDDARTTESRSAIFLENCSPDKPLMFPISASEGKGMIGLMDNTQSEISLDLAAGSFELEEKKEINVFSAM